MERARSFLREHWGQLTFQEVGGALGDLGIFIPFVVGLARSVGLDVGTTLLFTGLYNIVTGVAFNVPMPVQPMKSIGAVAIAESLTLDEMIAAGVCTSLWVILVGAVPLPCGGEPIIDHVNRLIPLPLVRGIQLGLGLSLARKGVQLMVLEGGVADAPLRSWGSYDGLATALLAATFAAYFRDADEAKKPAAPSAPADVAEPMLMQSHSHNAVESKEALPDDAEDPQDPPGAAAAAAAAPSAGGGGGRGGTRVPVALVLFLGGLCLTFGFRSGALSALSLGPSAPLLRWPSSSAWRDGFLHGALPQIPLTTMNSVVAVAHLSAELYPDRAARNTPGRIASSVGALNLLGLWFGVMPVCHGAGGLAAQHRFGARFGTAVIFLGAAKVLLSLLFGSTLKALLEEFPMTILGVMLSTSGLELASAAFKKAEDAARDCCGHGWFVLLFTAIVSLEFKTFYGFCAGAAVVAMLHARRTIDAAVGARRRRH